MSETAARALEKDFSPLGVLSRAGRLYGENVGRFLFIAFLGQFFYVAGELMSAAGGNAAWWAGRALFFPGLILHFWAGAAMIVAVRAADRGEDLSLKGCFDRVAPVFWWYVMALVIYRFVSLVGFLLLVVMGLYWGTRYSLAGCVAVLEGPSRDPGPLGRSGQLVRGSFWRVLVPLLVVLIPGAGLPVLTEVVLDLQRPVSGLLAGVWWMALWPLWTGVHVVIYGALSRSEPAEEETAEGQPGRGACLVGCLAALGLVVALIVLYIFWTAVLEGSSALLSGLA
jgi:hypothetical protein